MLATNIKSEDTGGNTDGLHEPNTKGIQKPSYWKSSSHAVLSWDFAEHGKIRQVHRSTGCTSGALVGQTDPELSYYLVEN